MKEGRFEDSSGGSRIDPLQRRILRDLAALVRAQSKVMEDLILLIEPPDETPEESDLEMTDAPADSREGGDEESLSGSDEEPEPEAPPAAPLEPVIETVVPDLEKVVAELGIVEPEEAPSEHQVEESLSDPLLEAIEVPSVVDATDDEKDEEDQEDDSTVLVLESGNARVGVLWDQVIKVGTLSEPTPPEQIETQEGMVDLVSLGSVLHGVSREERSFVVLADGDERIAIACERTAGLGPLASAMKGDEDERIQVLEVELLKTFAAGGKDRVGSSDIDAAARVARQHEEDVRDRNGPLRALVAVRYLPARVAICRFLRGRGWQVGEAAGLEAAIVSLDLGHWDALFLEARNNGGPDDAEQALMERVDELKVPVIRVGSRISGYPPQGGPSLIFPFSESELEAIVASVGAARDS